MMNKLNLDDEWFNKDGSYLVVKKKNCTTTKPVDPSFAELDAALHYLLDGMIESMHKASKMRPSSIKMSKKEQNAWKRYKKSMGKDHPSYFEYASLHEIAQAGCEYIKKQIVKKNPKKNKKNPKNKLINLEVREDDKYDPKNPILCLDIP